MSAVCAVLQSVMETDKENTSSYLQTKSAVVANYDRCNASSASRSKTMRPLTSGMGASSGESEVTSCLVNLYFCSSP